MVKSIRLDSPATVMRYLNTASGGSHGVSVARSIPLASIYNAAMAKPFNKDAVVERAFNTGDDSAVNMTLHSNQRSSSAVGLEIKRQQLVDMISNSLFSLINRSQLDSNSDKMTPFHQTNNGTHAPSFSIEDLIMSIDDALDRSIQALSSSNNLAIPLYSTSHSGGAVQSLESVSANSHSSDKVTTGVNSSTTFGRMSARVISVGMSSLDHSRVSLSFVDLLCHMVDYWSIKNHCSINNVLDRFVVVGESVPDVKAQQSLNAAKVWRDGGVTRIVEDCFGTAPIRYQQAMENGPPRVEYSSTTRELGES